MNEDVDVLMANSDEFAKRTLPSCPVPNDSAVEKKAELLRAIGREIAEGLVPETILETLEAVEKLLLSLSIQLSIHIDCLRGFPLEGVATFQEGWNFLWLSKRHQESVFSQPPVSRLMLQ